MTFETVKASLITTLQDAIAEAGEGSSQLSYLFDLLSKVGGASGLTDAELRATPVVVSKTPATRTPTLTLTSTSGTVASGCVSLSIANTGATSGTVLGASLPSGVTVDLEASWGDVLGAVAYDATGTTFLILELR